MTDALSYDPSLTCTAYAAGNRRGPSVDLLHAGFVGKLTKYQQGKRPLAERLKLLHDEAYALMIQEAPRVVIIETPARQAGRAQYGKNGKAPIGQARYGMAVMAVLAAAWKYAGEVSRAADADDWTRQVSKEKRALAIMDRYPEYRQVQDKGLDIADAIGLLCWWAENAMLEGAAR